MPCLWRSLGAFLTSRETSSTGGELPNLDLVLVGHCCRRPLFRILSRDPVAHVAPDLIIITIIIVGKSEMEGSNCTFLRSRYFCHPVWALLLSKNSQKLIFISNKFRTQWQNLLSGSCHNSRTRSCRLSRDRGHIKTLDTKKAIRRNELPKRPVSLTYL